MECSQRNTPSVAHHFKSPSFLAGGLGGHLIILSHFPDENIGPRSVKSISLMIRDRIPTGVQAHLTSPFLLILPEAIGARVEISDAKCFSAGVFSVGKITRV